MNKFLFPIILIILFIGYTLFNKHINTTEKVILIPAYFYPEEKNMQYWEEIIRYKEAGNKVIVVVNQNNGDFDEEDINYKNIITRLQGSDIELVGYVSTVWGKRDLSLVHQNIDSWKNLYNISSIFLDEVSTQKEDYPYYLDLSKHIVDQTIYNFGTLPDKAYSDLSGIKILYEDSLANLPLWKKDHSFNSHDVAIIVHSVDNPRWKEWFKDTKHSFKYYYFTHDVLDNPYDELTNYLEDPTK